MAGFDRRQVLGLGIGAASAAWVRPAVAAAEEAGTETHGLSVFGDLKYPADFQHFDYVNLAAPKGGTFSTIPSVRTNNQSYYTFNSFNAFILKGEGAQGMDLVFATLMARAADEPDAMYGQLAKSVRISPDKLVYRFTLRSEARFHDGSKITGAGCRVLAGGAADQGAPAGGAADARHGEGRGARRCDAAGDIRRTSRPRRAALRASACRFSPGPIMPTVRSMNVAGCSARLRALQGREVRGQWLHRIRAGQGLVGRRSSGRARHVQLRHRALRVLPRPRRRLRRFHRRQLSVPRRVHREGLGDTLRLPRRPGRPRQARDLAR